MQRLLLLLGAISITMSAAGSAGAAVWWTSQYDLTGSQAISYIYDPLTTGTAPDPWSPDEPGTPFQVIPPFPITGTMTVQWRAATVSAPITQGRIVGGNTRVDQYFNAGIFIVTGEANIMLLPPLPGDTGTITGAVFDVGVVSDSDQSGYTHCIVGACGVVGFMLSVPKPLTPTGPRPWTVAMPPWTFTGAGGAGAPGANWTAPSMHEVIPPNLPETPYTNVVQTLYVGSEVSRIIPEPSTALLVACGLVGLAMRRRRAL